MKEYQCSYCRRKTTDLTEWLLIQIGEANEQGDNGLPRSQLLCPKCKRFYDTFVDSASEADTEEEDG